MELNDVVVLASLCWGAVMTGFALHYKHMMTKAGFALMMITEMVKKVADGEVTIEKDGEDGIRVRKVRDGV
jgi:hypothetical protein